MVVVVKVVVAIIFIITNMSQITPLTVQQRGICARTQTLYPSIVELTYDCIPHFYSFTAQHTWKRRSRPRIVPTIGRMYYISSPTAGEKFYIRLLLLNRVGCNSFDSLRTVNGFLLPTFKAACKQCTWFTTRCQ